MYRIVDKQGTGKTYRLLEEADKNTGIVICSNPRAMQEKAYKYGFTHIFGFLNYEDTTGTYFDKPIYVDEIEKYLLAHFGRRLQGYTYTLEDNNEI